MKILLITSLFPPNGGGGAGKAVTELSQALVRAGHSAVVVSLTRDKVQTVSCRNGVTLYFVPLSNIYWPFGRDIEHGLIAKLLWHFVDRWNPLAAKRIGSILDLEKPDVVHTHILSGFSVAVWKAVKQRGIRLVHTMHDYYMLCDRSAMFRSGTPCKLRCADCVFLTRPRKASSSLVDVAISVSEYVKTEHGRYGYYAGVDSIVVHNVSPKLPALRSQRNERDKVLVFGFIGRLEPEKGIQQLLAAFEMVEQNGWKLFIAGQDESSFVMSLKQRHNDPRIVWAGYQKPADFYANVDVVVIPSQFPDPYPYVALESLEYGKPVIGARSGGIPEILALGSKVYIYEPSSMQDLISALESALNDPIAWKSGGFRDAYDSEQFQEGPILAQHLHAYTNTPERQYGLPETQQE